MKSPVGSELATAPRVFYFGCWNQAGHYLFAGGGTKKPAYGPERDALEYYNVASTGERRHLDGTLAPRRAEIDGRLVWDGMYTYDEKHRYSNRSSEYPMGQFLRHVLPNGFTALQWWDRCQGDTRGACNSTILVEGERTTEECLAALREHFPHVVANLEKFGVQLVEVTNAAAK